MPESSPNNEMEPLKKVNWFTRHAAAQGQVDVEQKYTEPVAIKMAKYKDLVKITEKHLPREYNTFYKHIAHGTDSMNESE
jgi:hypothetical protein